MTKQNTRHLTSYIEYMRVIIFEFVKIQL